jgi:DNA-binding transcriptional LysR family regulator
MQREQRLGHRLKLRQLEILLGVAEAGSMAKAAARLAVSQPAISRAIADAEKMLGVPLLDRSPRGVEPTQYGRALLKRGIAAFDEIAQGVREIKFLSDPTAGELWIGSTSGLSEGGVLAVINRLSPKYPRIVFHVLPCGAPALYDELRRHRVELGYVDIPRPAPEADLDTEVLFADPLAVVAGIENPWTRRRRIELTDLLNEPWTWPEPGTLMDSLVVEAFRAKGVEPPRATVYADAINLRTRLAATGSFLAVVPASMMNIPAKHPLLKILPVELSATKRQIGIVTLKNRTLSPLARRFIECAREVARPLAKAR